MENLQPNNKYKDISITESDSSLNEIANKVLPETDFTSIETPITNPDSAEVSSDSECQIFQGFEKDAEDGIIIREDVDLNSSDLDSEVRLQYDQYDEGPFKVIIELKQQSGKEKHSINKLVVAKILKKLNVQNELLDIKKSAIHKVTV